MPVGVGGDFTCFCPLAALLLTQLSAACLSRLYSGALAFELHYHISLRELLLCQLIWHWPAYLTGA